MESCPFVDDFPIDTSIYRGLPSQSPLMTPEGKKVPQGVSPGDAKDALTP